MDGIFQEVTGFQAVDVGENMCFFSNNEVLCMENDRNTCEWRLRFFFPVTVLRPFVNLTDALVVRLGTQLGR